jgi:bisanhydrobacterioruberin hydratase
MNTLKQKPLIGILIIAIVHFFGVLGIFSAYKDWFVSMTSMNLLLSFGLLLLYYRGAFKPLIGFIGICYVIGYVAEYLGVNYGILFGDYAYGAALGPALGGVPLIIGVNWFIVTYCCYQLAKLLNPKWHFAITIGAFFTVALDFFIEPVAIKLGYWQWDGGIIPLSNYIGWFMVSVIIISIYEWKKIELKNPIALPLLAIQALFFILIQVFS